jgi:hypothetical protein
MQNRPNIQENSRLNQYTTIIAMEVDKFVFFWGICDMSAHPIKLLICRVPSMTLYAMHRCSMQHSDDSTDVS